MTALSDHLSADELDALHAGTPASRAASHLATCGDCRALVALDTRLLAALGNLGGFEPSPGFIERTITRLDRPVMAPVAVTASPDTERSRAARRRVLIGGLVTGSALVGGFAWAAANPDAALGLAVPALNDVGNSLWLSIQTITATTIGQPWFATVRDTLATPARALPALLIAGGAYATVLLGLRRLLTRPAADAAW